LCKFREIKVHFSNRRIFIPVRKVSSLILIIIYYTVQFIKQSYVRTYYCYVCTASFVCRKTENYITEHTS
jgi:hypothetical protein